MDRALFRIRMPISGRNLAVWAILSALAGCSTVPAAPDVATVPVVQGTQPLSSDYHLAVGDEFEVRFPDYPDLNDKILIGPDGHASLQLINDVELGGLTVTDATDRLNARYSQVIKHPSPTLTVRSYALQQIFVDGAVGSPGVIRSQFPLTASRAIAQAGGLKLGVARLSQIILVRRGPDGKVYYYNLDFGNGFGTGIPAPGQDPLLQSYDLLYIPESEIASVAEFVTNTVMKIAPYTVTGGLSFSKSF
jgi:protein involved in polysaccharide export with SLBB domain